MRVLSYHEIHIDMKIKDDNIVLNENSHHFTSILLGMEDRLFVYSFGKFTYFVVHILNIFSTHKPCKIYDPYSFIPFDDGNVNNSSFPLSIS